MTEKCCNLSAEDTGFEEIKQNLEFIRQTVGEAMDKAGRKDTLRIMAVTKTVPVEKINYAEGLGIDLLGENRVQEFLGKYEGYSPKSEVHFIGALQSNKVKYIIDKVSMIHSVDNLKLAQEIDKRSAQHGKITDILLEVNIGGEESKSGVQPSQLSDIAAQAAQLSNVRIRGLMTIPPPGGNEIYFARMQELYEKLKHSVTGMDVLSMGMSADYAAAIKYGSTLVRIGSALFGYRNYIK
ncbi:MAG: YggS family pyridoxal phosphate-dependent enzyme [Eubacterium sp.]|nr:YggS family pyridoxal phosphate-dependent enzyme [Eubacterium sp.]